MEGGGWLFELAVLLRRPICELLDDVPAQELVMWHRWMQTEPRGDRRGDWHAAMIAKGIHDVALGFSGKQNPSQLEAYLPTWKLVQPGDATRSMKLAARSIFGSIVPLPKEAV